ncbi:hypothetical protein H7F36_11320 [Variovorax sp. PAMC28562]|uniref:hypothetical protein n=1 Tax=Variovorax sp. PAMC28562 TaxID=2762323 RepID=UPI00164EB38D|nr:hypothetical protein [Variovorax sp. PAMC28562]QNK71867.1 hypothetical protein H7F36_11320 [Variovorax sp. PAMC28562]
MTQWIAELSPLRKLLMAALVAIVCAQAVAMTMLVRSQVQKAEMREAAEASNRGVVATRLDSNLAAKARTMSVGYVAPR